MIRTLLISYNIKIIEWRIFRQTIRYYHLPFGGHLTRTGVVKIRKLLLLNHDVTFYPNT